MVWHIRNYRNWLKIGYMYANRVDPRIKFNKQLPGAIDDCNLFVCENLHTTKTCHKQRLISFLNVSNHQWFVIEPDSQPSAKSSMELHHWTQLCSCKLNNILVGVYLMTHSLVSSPFSITNNNNNLTYNIRVWNNFISWYYCDTNCVTQVMFKSCVRP